MYYLYILNCFIHAHLFLPFSWRCALIHLYIVFGCLCVYFPYIAPLFQSSCYKFFLRLFLFSPLPLFQCLVYVLDDYNLFLVWINARLCVCVCVWLLHLNGIHLIEKISRQWISALFFICFNLALFFSTSFFIIFTCSFI